MLGRIDTPEQRLDKLELTLVRLFDHFGLHLSITSDESGDYDVKISHKCESCGGEGTEAHVCPFADEIHGDDRKCHCCSPCQQSCAMDI